MEYFLNIEGQTSGPFGGFEIVSRIHEGQLKGEELGWRKGMAEWRPLRSFEDFAEEWPITPEQLAAAEEARALARRSLDTPQPWLRFWARMLDYGWFTAACCFLLAAVLPQAAIKFIVGLGITSTSDGVPAFSPFWYSFLLFLYAPIEALCLARYGTTPGKALLRIQVRTLQGRLPSYAQALKRGIIVYVKGIGLGLPIFNIIMLGLNWMRLPLRQVAEWDRATGLRVEHGEPEAWRIGLVLPVAILLIAANAMAQLLLYNLSKGQG